MQDMGMTEILSLPRIIFSEEVMPLRSWERTRQWLRQQTVSGGQSGSTLLEVVGRDRVVIERHRGIQCYGSEQIHIRTSYGSLMIFGSRLRLCCMSREQLCITGCIHEVKLVGRSGVGAME